MSLSFEEARARVVREAAGVSRTPIERVSLEESLGRVLAEDVFADRDQPPFDRSTRDGFALRSADLAQAPARLRVVGEVAAGSSWEGKPIASGECVEIMTGAPVPRGADAVLMVEYVERADGEISALRAVGAGENVVARGSECRAADRVLERGRRIDPAAVAVAASVGRPLLEVHARPRVAIIGTGAELVGVNEAPSPSQIRNSNSWSLAAQVTRAGGVPRRMPIARDEEWELRRIVEDALATAEVLVLSGGVSKGKYDLVEVVLADLGATFFFDAVDIRPGRPAVAGSVRGKPFFALPGNPLSTTLTFELFARPAIDMIGGASASPLHTPRAPLAVDFTQRSLPLHVFAPSVLEGEAADARVRPLTTQGSGDLVALARATHWMLIAPGVTKVAAGELVPLLAV
jgi:molybdopterin molybdotransferase